MIYDTFYDFLDMYIYIYISAMHRIFIQAGEIISDAHALNRPFKPTLLVDIASYIQCSYKK